MRRRQDTRQPAPGHRPGGHRFGGHVASATIATRFYAAGAPQRATRSSWPRRVFWRKTHRSGRTRRFRLQPSATPGGDCRCRVAGCFSLCVLGWAPRRRWSECNAPSPPPLAVKPAAAALCLHGFFQSARTGRWSTGGQQVVHQAERRLITCQWGGGGARAALAGSIRTFTGLLPTRSSRCILSQTTVPSLSGDSYRLS